MYNYNSYRYLLFLLSLLVGLVLGLSFKRCAGRNSEVKEVKKEIKSSETIEKNYKKSLDSLRLEYFKLEKQKQQVKTVYLQGKERIKYITKERIERYTDTVCKEDVISLKNHISTSDSLIAVQEVQLSNNSQQLNIKDKIIKEKDNRIYLYQNRKQRIKPFGIGIIGGYGTDFQNGLKPFIGLGISYNLIRF